MLALVVPLLVFAEAPPAPPTDDMIDDGDGGDDFVDATLVRVLDGHRVYEVVDGRRHWIPTAEIFNIKKFSWNDVEVISSSQLNAYSRIRLLRTIGDEKVYYLTESGMVRHIPTAEIFESYGNNWENVYEVIPDELNSYEPNRLIKTDNDPKVYLLENSTKRWIQTAEIFNARNYDWNKIAPVNQVEINHYQTGESIS